MKDSADAVDDTDGYSIHRSVTAVLIAPWIVKSTGITSAVSPKMTTATVSHVPDAHQW